MDTVGQIPLVICISTLQSLSVHPFHSAQVPEKHSVQKMEYFIVGSSQFSVKTAPPCMGYLSSHLNRTRTQVAHLVDEYLKQWTVC